MSCPECLTWMNLSNFVPLEILSQTRRSFVIFLFLAPFSALRSAVGVDCCILASLQLCIVMDCFYIGQSPNVRGGWASPTPGVAKSRP